jgi:hypothetical protein
MSRSRVWTNRIRASVIVSATTALLVSLEPGAPAFATDG